MLSVILLTSACAISALAGDYDELEPGGDLFPEHLLTCHCGKRCVFTLPREARTPNYTMISQYLVSKHLQPSAQILRVAVTSPPSSFNVSQMPTIKFGFLVEMMYPFILGAVSMAVEAVNSNAILLPNIKLDFVFERIHNAIAKMTEMRDQGVLAFIGSGYSCKNEALVAAAWNLPMVAFQCSDRDLSNKTVYPTFVRTQPPSEKIAKSIIAVLEHYSWVRAVVVSSSSGEYSPINSAFQSLAKDKNISVKRTEYIGSNYLSTEGKEKLEQIIQGTKDLTRVYVFIGDRVALLDFVMIMDELDLLHLPDPYVILATDIAVDLGQDESCQKYILPAWNWDYGHEDIIAVHDAFRSVLLILPAHQDRLDKKYKDMMGDIFSRSTVDPFCEPHHKLMETSHVPIEAAFMYDAVKVYALAADRVLRSGGDLWNGTEVIRAIIETGEYHSDIQGIDVQIDRHGDSEGNYILLAMAREETYCNITGTAFVNVGSFDYDSQHVPLFRPNNNSQKILWPNGLGDAFVPKSEPFCGFENERCQFSLNPVLISVSLLLFSIISIGAGFAWRHYRYEQKLARLLWKVDPKDVHDVEDLIPAGRLLVMHSSSSEKLRLNQIRDNSISNSISSGYAHESQNESLIQEEEESISQRLCTKEFRVKKERRIQIGYYRANLVTIKRIFKKTVDLKRNILKELNTMRDIRHDNLVPFLGACVESGNIFILSPYCSRGSLEDVLNNEDYRLDNMFVASLIADLLKGMIYLHDSDIIYHGKLKSSNCLVDTRWVLQVSEFGLRQFKAGEEVDRESLYYQQGLLWQAPELLRLQRKVEMGEAVFESGLFGTQRGDVFAFGLILYHIMGRQGPWGKKNMDKDDIAAIVGMTASSTSHRIYRPLLELLECEEYIKSCMSECWQEDPSERPDFRAIRQKLGPMQAGLKANIFDNMMAIMEKYATNLESQVAERTHLLMEEKKKTDALLYNMLPKTVADSLKQGIPVKAESFDCVTIYFSDVVGFTSISAASTPLEVVVLLNDLYTCFDSIIENYDVYKVETIGDAYMVVSGLPVRNGIDHAAQIASLALHLLTNIKSFEIRHKPGETLRLRIGVHSGPCVAGVVGCKMPRYCLFGDTVNTASRMESTGEPLKVHMSHTTYDILQQIGGYEFEERGPVFVKGKGEMITYWLLSRLRAPAAGPTHEASTQTIEDRRGSSRRIRHSHRKPTEKDIFDLIQDIPPSAASPTRGKVMDVEETIGQVDSM